jgi:phosphoglycolate phosphatase-like HAD superfamily hydrolase
MMVSPRLVVFDLAGTTVEDPGAVNRCLRDALRAAGVAVGSAEVDAVMGRPKPEAIRLLVEASDLRLGLRGRLDAIYEDFACRMERYYREDPAVREIPGTGEVFRILRRPGRSSRSTRDSAGRSRGSSSIAWAGSTRA